MALIHKEVTTSAVISAGAWSANTQKFTDAILLHVIVQAPTSTTTFDFKLTDEDGIVIQLDGWKRIREELNDLIYLPVSGVYTMAIENSSADETFKVKLLADEG